MKEYKEGKQKTATMVNKRRLSPPSIYEGSSPVYFSVAFYRKILFLPPSSALLWPPFWVTLARVRFQPFWTTKILETSSFSRQTAPPTGPSFQLERREPRGGGGGGAPFRTVSSGAYTLSAKGREKEEKEKRKERKGKKKLAETASSPLAKSHCTLMETHSKMFRPWRRLGLGRLLAFA